MSKSRQLAAIMFTDIVGYTAIMGQDSQKALKIVDQSLEIQKPLVEKYNGKWLKEMGDGALARFDSALDAINCAVEIQKTARIDFEATFRIGIHIGDIHIDGNDIFGDGVNVASRLESVADPGGIYVSESVEKSVKGQTNLQLKHVGKLKFKNVSYPVRTYALQGDGLPPVGSGGSRKSLVAVMLMLVAVSSLLTIGILNFLKEEPVPPQEMRTSILPPDSVEIELIGTATVGVGRRVIDLSNDGSKLVYIGSSSGKSYAYIRNVDSFDSQQIPATEGAYCCRFSPEGNELACLIGNAVWKIDINSGNKTKLSDVSNPMDIYWPVKDSIYYSADEGLELLLIQGNSKARTIISDGEFETITGISERNLLIFKDGPLMAQNRITEETTSLDIEGLNPLSFANGDLYFTRGTTLWYTRIDLDNLTVITDPIEILAGLRQETYGSVQYDVSSDGTIVYIPGESTYLGELTWVYPSGKTETLPFPKANYGQFKLSPDGTKLAVVIPGTETYLWLYDLNKNQPVRLINLGTRQSAPSWIDNETVLLSNSEGIIKYDINQRAEPKSQIDSVNLQSVSPESGNIIYFKDGDIFMSGPEGEGAVNMTSTSNSWEFHASISPDGKLLTYTSDRSEAFQVYLQKTTKDSPVVQISINEGSEEPRWTADNRFIVYRSGRKWMKVEVLDPETLETSVPTEFVVGDYVNIGGFSFDVDGDGSRLLMSKGTDVNTANEIRVIKNLIPGGRKEER